MNQDDDMRDDAQDDETPEEMVNRSLAEAIENQQRYMEMFRNSAHMLHVMSRFMADPIVVHDLEVVSDDGTASSITPSSSSSPSSPPQSPQQHKNNDTQDTPVMTYRIHGECTRTNTVALRAGRLTSAGARRLSMFRQHCSAATGHAPVSRTQPTPEIPQIPDSRNEETRNSCVNHEGSGDNGVSKSTEKDGTDRTSRQSNPCNTLVSTSSQTPSNPPPVNKNNVGVGSNAIGARVPVDTNSQQRNSIGVSTQTSINTAMSEISKAADTIRRARTMLSSLNLGTAASRAAMSQQQMNNNNRKEATGSDKEDDVIDDPGHSGQGRGDCPGLNVPSQEGDNPQQNGAESNVIDSDIGRQIRSIFVNVKPSDEVGGSSNFSNTVAGTSAPLNNSPAPLYPAACNTPEAFPQQMGDAGQSGRVSSQARKPHSRRRQRTTVTAGIAGASQPPANSNTEDARNASNLIEVRGGATRCYAFDADNIPKMNFLFPRSGNDDSSNDNLAVTIEMFQTALSTAIKNLEKGGLWSGRQNDSGNLSESKINGNCFTMPSLQLSPSRKEFLSNIDYTFPSCSCSETNSSQNESEMIINAAHAMENVHTNVVAFDAEDTASSVNANTQFSSESRAENKEHRQSDVESTFGICSSVHLSPVLPFHEEENTEDEVTTLVHEEIAHDAGRKSEPREIITGREDLSSAVRLGNSRKFNANKCGGGDSVLPFDPPNEADEGCSSKNRASSDGGNQSVAPHHQRDKPGIFRRFTSAIKLCSFKRK